MSIQNLRGDRFTFGDEMLDENNKAVLAAIKDAGWPPMHEMQPQQLRDFTASMCPPTEGELDDRPFEVAGGMLSVRIIRPIHPVAGVIIFYPGGGWMLNTKQASHAAGRALSEATNCVVVLAEYRLAPEYRFPTAADDATAALYFVADQIEKIAGRVVPLIVAGESAGGNLAAVVAARVKDRNGPPIAAQILVYPVTNNDFDTPSYIDPENQLYLNRETMQWFWHNYVPVLEDRTHPDAAPMRRADLNGLPPAVVVTAEHDVLRDEGELYAGRLKQDGVSVYQRRFVGQMHGFFSSGDALPVGKEAIAYVADALKRILADRC
jgi:acetyl esterase